MSRTPHVSEPKWGDDPYEADQKSCCDSVTIVLAGVLFVIAVWLVAVWFWLVSTVTPQPQKNAHRITHEFFLRTQRPFPFYDLRRRQCSVAEPGRIPISRAPVI